MRDKGKNARKEPESKDWNTMDLDKNWNDILFFRRYTKSCKFVNEQKFHALH